MRRRWRTIFLVTGTTLSVLIAVAFVVSAWFAGWNEWEGSNRPRGSHITMLLYALFLVVAASTLAVWRLVPRYPRGHCKHCGYNLTGNVSGRCPECGVEASQ